MVDEGDIVEFRIMVSNNGPSNATGVKVSDKLPSGLAYVSHRANRGTYNPSTGIWDLGNFPTTMATAELIIEAEVEEGTAGVTLTNRASVSADQQDPNSTNNSDTAQVRVRTVTPPPGNQADLGVSKVVNVPTAKEGDLVMFTVAVRNYGPAEATGVSVSDALPNGLSYVAHNTTVGVYTPATGLWTIGTVAPNTPVEIRLVLVAQVGLGTQGRTLTNEAQIRGNELDPDSRNNLAQASVTAVGPGGQDDDGDGLPNPVDPCPTDPDCDDDGIPDGMDPCPQVPGVFCEGVKPSVVINELGWSGTTASVTDQWLELFSLVDEDVVLDGWRIEVITKNEERTSIELAGTIKGRGFYVAERGHDKVISDIPAGTVFSALIPLEGAILWLVNARGMVVDLVNPSGGPWPAGINLPRLAVSMERIKADAPGTEENWKNNNTVQRRGLDALGLPINGTPGGENSK